MGFNCFGIFMLVNPSLCNGIRTLDIFMFKMKCKGTKKCPDIFGMLEILRSSSI